MKHLYVLWLFIATTPHLYAQPPADNNLPPDYLSVTQSKLQDYQSKVDRQLLKAINRAEQLERRAIKRLKKIDPVKAKSLTQNCEAKFSQWRSQLAAKVPTAGMPGQFYNQYLDTLQGVFRYLEKNSNLTELAQKALGQLNGLQNALGTSDRIFDELRDRQRSLLSDLSTYTNLAGHLGKYKKEMYYYSQQTKEIKESLSDPVKAERKAMTILRQSKGFNRFMEKHSLLSGLFGVNMAESPAQALEGLQTRSQIDQALLARIGTDPSARQAANAQLNQARDQFSRLKAKFPNLDRAAEMPDFKPNNMRTKPFLQRLKLGGNLEFKRANNWYPGLTDVGLQIGYQLHEKKTVGIGLSYKASFGSLDHLRYSHEGIGLRSFLEWKVKDTYYFNGGVEMNHYQSFSNVRELKNWNGWQRSALMGFSRKYKINAKLNGSLQVLYDFLARRQAPFNSPFLIRFNYSKN
ncbi:hypothetical protein [Chitinophaga tropicalis]|uniref:Uncharacterized protein n=1 Tax=Chitinophaga tropicalis TaxID=2683588 RepID=A0A7K1U031_9BACT|nr:hypothetical protein [Chitinophaga tropicalis]MVT07724.1 hypothetical protein [Chitinophaga tropicalis]